MKDRERRVVKLFTLGDVDEDAIREQASALKRQRKIIEDRITAASRNGRRSFENVDLTALNQVCAGLADWLQEADEEPSVLALEALQLSVVATREEATIRGVLPRQLPDFLFRNMHRDARFSNNISCHSGQHDDS